MSDRRDVLNQLLHDGIPPCETACTHVVFGRWTALGLANVLARRVEAVDLIEATGGVPEPIYDDPRRWQH